MPRSLSILSLILVCLCFGNGASIAAAEEAPPLEEAPLSKKVLREVKKISAKIERQVDQKEWKKIAADWDEALSAAEAYVKDERYDSAQSKLHYSEVNKVTQEALNSSESVQSNLEEQQKLLETLGAAPREDQVQESEEISKKRALYLAQVSQLEARVAQIQLTLQRAESLAEQLSSLRREQSLDQLMATKPLPLTPHTIAVAVPEFLHHTATVSTTALEWLNALRKKITEHIDTVPAILAVLALVVALFLLRRFLLARYGRDPEQDSPSYSRRAIAALVEVFAQGGIPAVILISVHVAITQTEVGTGTLFTPVDAGFKSALIFILLARMFHQQPRSLQ